MADSAFIEEIAQKISRDIWRALSQNPTTTSPAFLPPRRGGFTSDDDPPGAWPAFMRPEVAGPYIGASRSHLYRLEKSDPEFPRRMQLGTSRYSGWRKVDLDAWLEKKAAKEERL